MIVRGRVFGWTKWVMFSGSNFRTVSVWNQIPQEVYTHLISRNDPVVVAKRQWNDAKRSQVHNSNGRLSGDLVFVEKWVPTRNKTKIEKILNLMIYWKCVCVCLWHICKDVKLPFLLISRVFWWSWFAYPIQRSYVKSVVSGGLMNHLYRKFEADLVTSQHITCFQAVASTWFFPCFDRSQTPKFFEVINGTNSKRIVQWIRQHLLRFKAWDLQNGQCNVGYVQIENFNLKVTSYRIIPYMRNVNG